MDEEKEGLKFKIPMQDPKYINDNYLWDSIWLMKKYTDNHLKKIDINKITTQL